MGLAAGFGILVSNEGLLRDEEMVSVDRACLDKCIGC